MFDAIVNGLRTISKRGVAALMGIISAWVLGTATKWGVDPDTALQMVEGIDLFVSALVAAVTYFISDELLSRIKSLFPGDWAEKFWRDKAAAQVAGVEKPTAESKITLAIAFLLVALSATAAHAQRVDTADVRVLPRVADVIVTPQVADVGIGETFQFTAVALDTEGDTVPGVTFRFYSTAPAVLEVDSVTGVGRGVTSGRAQVYARVASEYLVMGPHRFAFNGIEGNYYAVRFDHAGIGTADVCPGSRADLLPPSSVHKAVRLRTVDMPEIADFCIYAYIDQPTHEEVIERIASFRRPRLIA